MSIAKLAFHAVLCFSVATLLAEAAGVAALWARGAWTQEKLVKLVAIANDVDLAEMRDRLESSTEPEPSEYFPFDEITSARAAASADLDLRQLALDRALDNASFLEVGAESRYQKHLQLKTQFDQQLQQLRQTVPAASQLEVQRELESMTAKMAKDQLLRMLDNRHVSQEASLQFVANVLKGMPPDRRKKILAEFKGEETNRLHEILQEIRRGVPEAALARQTRQQLQELERLTPQP